MGLREEKKKLYKKKIIDAAKEVFLKEGFQKATTKKIAALAGIGEGTIYNHFKSKNDILIDIYNNMLLSNKKEYTLEYLESKSLTSYIKEYTLHYIMCTEGIEKEWIRECFSAIYQSNSENLFAELSALDMIWLDDFSKLLSTLSDKGLVDYPDNINNTIHIIYSIYMQSYSNYIIKNDMTFDEFISSTLDQIIFLVENTLSIKKIS